MLDAGLSSISLCRLHDARLWSAVSRNVDCLDLLVLLLCVAWAVVMVNWLDVSWNRRGLPRSPSLTLMLGTVVLRVMVLSVVCIAAHGLAPNCVVVAYVCWDLGAVVVTGMLVVKKTLQPLPSGAYELLRRDCSVRRTSKVTLLPPVLLCDAGICAQYSSEQELDTFRFPWPDNLPMLTHSTL